MNKGAIFYRNSYAIGVPLMLIVTISLLTQTAIFSTQPNLLAIGITADLLITIPVIYFLLIRKTNIPKTTVVPFLVLGMVLCSTLLPQEHQSYFLLFKKWIFPIVEISVIAFIIYKVKNVIQQYQSKKDTSLDFFTALKSTCTELLPKPLVMPFVTEIAVFYYGLIYWKKRPLKENEFSYYKESGSPTLLAAIIFIIAIETIVLHAVIAKSSIVIAWILSFLSIYSGFQLLGFLKSIIKRPILIKDDKLYLRYGIMNESVVNIKDIVSVNLSSKDIEDPKEIRKLSILGPLESHNIIITLKEEYTLMGLYGIKKTYKKIALSIDDKITFKNTLDSYNI